LIVLDLSGYRVGNVDCFIDIMPLLFECVIHDDGQGQERHQDYQEDNLAAYRHGAGLVH
jgi:hypothetical protein